MTLRDLTFAVLLLVGVGFLLWIGRPILVPVLAALISVYVLSAAAHSMGRIPPLGHVPPIWRRALVLVLFTVAVVGLFFLVTRNIGQVATALPRYETNLDLIIEQGAAILGIEDEPTWETVRQETIGRFDTRALVSPVLSSIQGIGATLFLVVLYASFFMAERGVFAEKVVIAAGGRESGERTISLLRRVNERIGGYLFVKTALNVVLGGLSFALMWLIGIEFALFWAVLIGFLNYIPYFGSVLGVAFPVFLSLAQFGSWWTSAGVMAALSAVQILVGAYLEPRMMGRAFNLSPFVVLLALSVWSALWGLAGAILAVPMTASLVLVLAEFRTTRPLAVMMSTRGRV